MTTGFSTNPAQATPKTLTTGEYPDAAGARCKDVEYASRFVNVSNTDGTIFATPPNPKGPTLVNIGLYINEITGVDEGANSYNMRGLLDMIWCDPRLGFDPAQIGTNTEIFLKEDARNKLDHIWWPNTEFINEEEAASVEDLTLFVHPDGTVEYRSRFNATFASDFDLHSFPFDKQDLIVNIESFDWANDALTFLAQDNNIGFSNEFRIPEWYVTGVSQSVINKKEFRDKNEFSEFAGMIHVTRDPGVYTTKVMIRWWLFLNDGIKAA